MVVIGGKPAKPGVEAMTGFFTIFLPVFYAAGAFIIGLISAALYNLVAKWTGGFEFKIHDTTPGAQDRPARSQPSGFIYMNNAIVYIGNSIDPAWLRVAGYIGLAFLFLSVQIYFLGVKMSEPEKMIKPIPGGLTPQEEALMGLYKDFLASARLQFRSAFRFGSIVVAVYQQDDQPRFFSFYFHKQMTFSVESYLEDLTILDTSNSGQSGLFPRPGAYLQSFPGISAEELWKIHLEGEAHLTMRFGYHFVPLSRSYEEILPEAMRVRMQYNRSQFLWPVRVLYRYFVTRYTVRNKTIAQQFP